MEGRERKKEEEEEEGERKEKEGGEEVRKEKREEIGILDSEGRRLAAYDRMIELAQTEQKKLRGRKPPKERWSLK